MAPSNLSSPKSRDFHARAILGPNVHDRLPNVKALIVGAGGIGCELRMLRPVSLHAFH
jgi:ubiquitin-like 1-activating enzyme E1 B